MFFVDGGEGRWLIGAERIVSVKVEAMIAISQLCVKSRSDSQLFG